MIFFLRSSPRMPLGLLKAMCDRRILCHCDCFRMLKDPVRIAVKLGIEENKHPTAALRDKDENNILYLARRIGGFYFTV
ncbi:hypothetical protein QQ045_012582 [Rhodiola kirilowii]